MKNFKILRFLDLFRIFFRLLGVDYNDLRRILQVKLTLDSRRASTILGGTTKKNDQDKNFFIRSLWFYAFMGLSLLVFFFVVDQFSVKMTIIFGIIMFLIVTTLISDFSSVLLDLRDKTFIATKPVTMKTLSMAKSIHVMIYLTYVTLAIAGPTLIAGLIVHGILFTLIYLVSLFLINLLIVVITTLVYLVILKFFNGEKLKDIINYVQIFLSVSVAISYQFVGRLFEVSDDQLTVAFQPQWWQYLIIPAWFSGPFEVIINHDYSIYYTSFTILAGLIPILSIFLYVKLIPSFEQHLQKLDSVERQSGKIKKDSIISKFICKKQSERTFYKFAGNMIKHERDFKLKVYPSLGISLILPFIFMFNQAHTFGFEQLRTTKIYFSIYFVIISVSTVIMVLEYSKNYKGSWIFRSAPIASVTPVIKGTLKASFVKLILPVFIIDSVAFGFIFGPKIIIDLIIVLLTMLILMVLIYRLMGWVIPFSQTYDLQKNQGGTAFLGILMIGLFAMIHFITTRFDYASIIYLVILLIATPLVWKFGLNISWKKVSQKREEKTIITKIDK
ncbi:membrane protein [Haloplasma contractile]|uniref:Membrane protein n=1 Tax=Haloplasma contractile SSD-17B TaxID=1033810 RepID=U2DUF2_9MOLU|nr:membrane protein [Haloplasma contractile]ERJ12027.1 Putative membrane protein [Haloplasma contractile SSD-17B]